MVHSLLLLHLTRLINAVDDLVASSEWLVNSSKDSLTTNHSPLTTQLQLDLFADFNGIPDGADKTDFYQHDAHWTNRMILGDSLQVMASLAEREGLRGKVQCIYLDPPYGIKFNSNFQWSTTNRDVKDGKADHITREPEQVKAFRDTWRDGIHSYLTYLRDRLTVARDLLSDNGSIFVQIGDENVHRVRGLMDEIFGSENLISEIIVAKTTSATAKFLPGVSDFIIWYSKKQEAIKYHSLFADKSKTIKGYDYRVDEAGIPHRGDEETIGEKASLDNLTSQSGGETTRIKVNFYGKKFSPKSGGWKTSPLGMSRLKGANRLGIKGSTLRYIRRLSDFSVKPRNNIWDDISSGGFVSSDKLYVVQTVEEIVQRCILMTTDPGDLVLDPTCGSGTTAYVAEQWGRRWITIDTSRVALALARARIMGARYPYYLLTDSTAGQQQEAEITRTETSQAPTYNNIRQGFVYDRVPHITLKAIANNAEIDVIWEQFQPRVQQALTDLNTALKDHPTPYKATTGGRANKTIDFTTTGTVQLPSGEDAPANALLEWEVPRDKPTDWPDTAQPLLDAFWQARIARQTEIDASIAAKADQEFLYDKPYIDKSIVRVSGPFTVESLSPHRVLAVNENDELIDERQKPDTSGADDFANVILENLKTAGVQQAHKEAKITFTSIKGWPGDHICAEGIFEVDSDEWLGDSKTVVNNGEEQVDSSGSQLTTNHSQLTTKRAGIFIGPEFGTVSRIDLVAAAREAGDAGFDVVIACAFNYDAHSAEFTKLGRIPILKARMNADLHMADTLANTGAGNLFVIFGEPDILVANEEWLVDSSGARVAPYEIFKLVSGVDSLAEVNRLSRQDLQRYAGISCRREIWDYLTDAASRHFNSSQYSRGTSQKDDRGVSAVAWHCAGIIGGTGNLSDFVRKAGLLDSDKFRDLTQTLHRDQQNAHRSDEIPNHAPLTTHHYSQVTIYGVDVFHPQSGEVHASDTDEIACWFIDTDYNEESFFVRHAYFLGASDPYKSLKTTLKAEIDEEAWESLYGSTSRPFDKPKSGRIAVKVINHLGDEVMKVFSVS